MSGPPRVLPPLSPERSRGNPSACSVSLPSDTSGQQHAQPPLEGQMTSVDHLGDNPISHCVSANVDNNADVLPVYYSVDSMTAEGEQHMLPSGMMTGQPVAIPVSGAVNAEPPSSDSLTMQPTGNLIGSGTESQTVLPSSYHHHHQQIPVSVQDLVLVPMYSGVPGVSMAPTDQHVRDRQVLSAQNTLQSAATHTLQDSEASYQVAVPASMQQLSTRGSAVMVEPDYYNPQPSDGYVNGELLRGHQGGHQGGPSIVAVQHHPRMSVPAAVDGVEADRPNLSYYTMRQKPMHVDLGPCSSEFRTYFHRQQGSKQLHHFISELLGLEEYLPREACFRDDNISSWSLEYYDPEYTEVLDRLMAYSTRHRLSTPASGLEQLLALYVKSLCCEGQFRQPSDVADFCCSIKPTCTDADTQTDDTMTHSNKRFHESSTTNLTAQSSSGDAEVTTLNVAPDEEEEIEAEVVTRRGRKKGRTLNEKKKNLRNVRKKVEKQLQESVTNAEESVSHPSAKHDDSPLLNRDVGGDNQSKDGAIVAKESNASDDPNDINRVEGQQEMSVGQDQNDDSVTKDLPQEGDEAAQSTSKTSRATRANKRSLRNGKQCKSPAKKRKTESDGPETSETQVPTADSECKSSSRKKPPLKVGKCDVGIQIGQAADIGDPYEGSKDVTRKNRTKHQTEQICFLTCMVCGITFTDLEAFQDHDREHPSLAQYYCEVCDAMYSSKAHFLQHGMKHYGMMEYKCSHCQWYFPTMKHLRDHFSELVPVVRCPVCEELLSKFNLNKHFIEHIKGNFAVLQQLHGHQPELLFAVESQLTALAMNPGQAKAKGKHGNEGEETVQSEKKKAKNGNSTNGVGQDKDKPLRPWMMKNILGEEVTSAEIHEDLKSDVIPLTKFEGENVLHQGKPINFYTQKTKIPCVNSECDISNVERDYNSKALYFPPNTRAVVRSGILKFYQKETFNCSICFKIFSKKLYLNEHYKFVHLHERTHQCSKCSKTFVHATDLGQHMRKYHEDPTNHKCTVCNKVFKDKPSLTKHREAQDCGKVQCHICKKPFNKRYLREHINFVHKQVKTKCNYCGKSFSTATARRRCEKIHWGTKNYLCADCGKSYFVISDLIQHRKHHHSEENT